MLFSISTDGVNPCDNGGELPNGDILALLTKQELLAFCEKLAIPDRIVSQCADELPTKFESYEGFDFVSLNIPRENLDGEHERIFIYFRKGLLVFVRNHSPELDAILHKMDDLEEHQLSLERIFYSYFDRLTLDDTDILEALEETISDLEDDLITTGKSNCLPNIVTLRKKLRVLKRYYEQLIAICEAVEEDENNLMGRKTLRYFKMLTSRNTRLYSAVVNLRDYVTQVREAYQAQVDIDLNSLMKLFTVVTSIFLPLTLIAGWYGMNLKMPEFGWMLGYPFVILLSLSVVFVTVWLFWKNKWF